MKRFLIRVTLLLIILLGAAFVAYRLYRSSGTGSNNTIAEWLTNPDSHELLNSAAFSRCPNAPFILPTEGFIGLLWNDSSAPYNFSNRHTGIDIFGYGASGTIPIYAVYDGYLTRQDDWRSTVNSRSLATTSFFFPSYSPILPHFSSNSSIFGKIATFISS